MAYRIKGWILAGGLLGLFAPVGGAQDLSADEMIDGLEAFLKKKNDDNATGTIELLASSFPNFTESEQKKVVKAVQKCLSQRREEGDNRLYLAALDALTHMGPLGQKANRRAVGHRNVKDRRDVLAKALKALAAHRDPGDVAILIKHLVYKEPVVVAASAEALGENYDDQPEKVRKEIVGELVKNYATYHSAAVANPREPIYRDRLNVVERPMQVALQRLTGQQIESAVDWQKWYNDNKRKKWDADSGR